MPKTFLILKIKALKRRVSSILYNFLFFSMNKKRKIISEKSNKFWSTQSNWIYAEQMPERNLKQINFINNYFIPILKPTDNICEFACATGEFTVLAAPNVNKITAFDISPLMIENAKKRAESLNINNIDFFCETIENIKLQEKFNAFICLGLLLVFMMTNL